MSLWGGEERDLRVGVRYSAIATYAIAYHLPAGIGDLGFAGILYGQEKRRWVRKSDTRSLANLDAANEMKAV